MFCEKCGKEIADNSLRCAYCGFEIVKVNCSASSWIPNNSKALISYYSGFISLLSCAPLLGILTLWLGLIAVIFGHKGVNYARNNGGVGSAHAYVGLILGYINVIFGLIINVGVLFLLLNK